MSAFPKLDQLNIMIVDDDIIIRQILIEFLQTYGLKNFFEFGDGAEAFRYLLDSKNQIDLIISDWQMPKEDGLTLLRGVRAHKTRFATGFIMLTSQQSDERAKILSAKKYEVDGYIVKPFRGETLREKVFQVLLQKKPAA